MAAREPAAMRLILLRHGETDWNALDRYQGRTDVPLNARGERQAHAAAAGPVGELLREAGALVAVASPLARAAATARIVLEDAVGAVEPALDPALVELHGGRWEGLALTEIADRWPAEHAAWRTVPDLDAGPVGGEVLRDGGARVLRAAAAHVPAAWRAEPSRTGRPGRAAGAATDGGEAPPTLLVVAHGAVLRAAVGLLLGREGEGFASLARLDNARAAVLDGAFPADAAPAPTSEPAPDAWGNWTLRGYNV